MNKIKLLLGVELRELFNSMKVPPTEKKRYFTKIIIAVILIVSLAPMYFMFIASVWNSFELVQQMGYEEYFLQIGIVAAQVLTLVLALPVVLNKYYFTSDTETLIPMPFKPFEILGAKFISLMGLEVFISALVFLPFLITMGAHTEITALFIIYSIAVTLLLPVLPIVLVSLIVMVFMRFTNLGRKKDIIRGIGLFLILAIAIASSVLMQKMGAEMLEVEMSEAEMFSAIAVAMDNYMTRITTFFPMAKLGGLAIYNSSSFSGATNGLIYIVVSALSIAVLLMLSQKIYLNNFLDGGHISQAKKAKNYAIGDYKNSKVYIAIAKKELIILLKTPIYLMNSVVGTFIIPIILAITMGIDPFFKSMLDEFIVDQNLMVLLVSAFAIFLVIGSPANTSFSREGKNFWIQKHLPITAKDQAMGRSIAALAIMLLGILSTLIVGNIMFDMSVFSNIAVIVLSATMSLPIIALGLLIDVLRPKLNWKSPQEAMKQNTNVLISMVITMLYLIGLVVGNIYIVLQFGFGIGIVINLLIGLGLSAIIYKTLIRTIEKKMN